MRRRTYTELSSTQDDQAASLLSVILAKKRRNVEYQLYLLDFNQDWRQSTKKREGSVNMSYHCTFIQF